MPGRQQGADLTTSCCLIELVVALWYWLLAHAVAGLVLLPAALSASTADLSSGASGADGWSS